MIRYCTSQIAHFIYNNLPHSIYSNIPQTDHPNAMQTTTNLIISDTEDGMPAVSIRRDTQTAAVNGSRQYPSVHTHWKNELETRVIRKVSSKLGYKLTLSLAVIGH